MNTRCDPKTLSVDLLTRSICAVQVAAVLEDKHGILAWGWNGMGADGMGEHAEAAALRRANPQRCRGAIAYVAAQRLRNGRTVIAKPCLACQRALVSWGIYVVYWRDSNDKWYRLVLKG